MTSNLMTPREEARILNLAGELVVQLRALNMHNNVPKLYAALNKSSGLSVASSPEWRALLDVQNFVSKMRDRQAKRKKVDGRI